MSGSIMLTIRLHRVQLQDLPGVLPCMRLLRAGFVFQHDISSMLCYNKTITSGAIFPELVTGG